MWKHVWVLQNNTYIHTYIHSYTQHHAQHTSAHAHIRHNTQHSTQHKAQHSTTQSTTHANVKIRGKLVGSAVFVFLLHPDKLKRGWCGARGGSWAPGECAARWNRRHYVIWKQSQSHSHLSHQCNYRAYPLYWKHSVQSIVVVAETITRPLICVLM